MGSEILKLRYKQVEEEPAWISQDLLFIMPIVMSRVKSRVKESRLPDKQLLLHVQQLIHSMVSVISCFGERSHGWPWDP
ncbi:hypothetical protein TNCV_1517611 [Trichonephila clavipes]|nr:hypothetical protein TNCV_1517611 [Trichonephila clavipes]